ncbi:MAG: hypothetical protein M1459_00075 [Patescibacteria group bacterium]|nr:hypothetical protein [Patescibacteria group bacterium]
MKKIILRIIFDILLFGSVAYGYWYIGIIVGIIGIMTMPFYIEFIIAGIAYDSLYLYGRNNLVSRDIGFFVALALSIIGKASSSFLRN